MLKTNCFNADEQANAKTTKGLINFKTGKIENFTEQEIEEYKKCGCDCFGFGERPERIRLTMSDCFSLGDHSITVKNIHTLLMAKTDDEKKELLLTGKNLTLASILNHFERNFGLIITRGGRKRALCINNLEREALLRCCLNAIKKYDEILTAQFAQSTARLEKMFTPQEPAVKQEQPAVQQEQPTTKLTNLKTGNVEKFTAQELAEYEELGERPINGKIACNRFAPHFLAMHDATLKNILTLIAAKTDEAKTALLKATTCLTIMSIIAFFFRARGKNGINYDYQDTKELAIRKCLSVVNSFDDEIANKIEYVKETKRKFRAEKLAKQSRPVNALVPVKPVQNALVPVVKIKPAEPINETIENRHLVPKEIAELIMNGDETTINEVYALVWHNARCYGSSTQKYYEDVLDELDEFYFSENLHAKLIKEKLQDKLIARFSVAAVAHIQNRVRRINEFIRSYNASHPEPTPKNTVSNPVIVEASKTAPEKLTDANGQFLINFDDMRETSKNQPSKPHEHLIGHSGQFYLPLEISSNLKVAYIPVSYRPTPDGAYKMHSCSNVSYSEYPSRFVYQNNNSSKLSGNKHTSQRLEYLENANLLSGVQSGLISSSTNKKRVQPHQYKPGVHRRGQNVR